MIRTFEELERTTKSKSSRRLALAMAEERDALIAVINAAEQGIVEPILTGKERSIREIAEKEGMDISPFRIVSVDGEERCAAKAVELVREGEAEVLMKGRTPTAVIAAVEKVNPVAMPVTVDAALLSKMSDRGQIPGCIVDGPFALDNALSRKSCETKGIQSEVGGDADILLMPDIEAANVFYKTLAS